jgi:Domain of unknown function (DUF5615)
MRILLDEDVPRPVVDLLRHLLRGHDVDHVQLIKWAGKKDLVLYQDAKRAGYDVVVTKAGRRSRTGSRVRSRRRSGPDRGSPLAVRHVAHQVGAACWQTARCGGRADLDRVDP